VCHPATIAGRGPSGQTSESEWLSNPAVQTPLGLGFQTAKPLLTVCRPAFLGVHEEAVRIASTAFVLRGFGQNHPCVFDAYQFARANQAIWATNCSEVFPVFRKRSDLAKARNRAVALARLAAPPISTSEGV